MTATDVRALAFYLPQFHPIAENDEWWGKGFTEWTNVAKAKPLFRGHYQPHLPADLGFYDLRSPETRQAQAELAREHGIHGFCYYHYWFNGRRVLERPFNEVLASGKPDFPFCLCWANENWTRIWEGDQGQVLLRQEYNHDDDLAHINALIPAFQDQRYIRIGGKPLFLVYRPEYLPDPKRTTAIWREAAARAGIGALYLAKVESYESSQNPVDPKSIGFDAEVEFAPFSCSMGKLKFKGPFASFLARLGLLSKGYAENRVASYDTMVRSMLNRPVPPWTRFHCVTPSWDNSPRRENALIFEGAAPEKYGAWLQQVVARTVSLYQGEERLVFINAWNEWAEGNHLEPDLKFGRAYLEATLRALQGAASDAVPLPLPEVIPDEIRIRPSYAKQLYWRAQRFLKDQIELLRALGS